MKINQRIYEYFWAIVIISTAILYISMGLSSLDDKYNLKVIHSAFSVTGEKSPLTLESPAQEFNLAAAGKAAIVGLIEMDLGSRKSISSSSSKSKRVFASSFGETDLRYHFKLKSGNWVPTTLDFSTNILYNLSYIANTPVKLVHNLKYDVSSNDITLPLSTSERWIFVFWDILHAVSGAGLAFLMLFAGCLIGLLFHPIQSIVNFIPCLWQLVLTLWHAVSNFTKL